MVIGEPVLVSCWEQKSDCNVVNKGWEVVIENVPISPPSPV